MNKSLLPRFIYLDSKIVGSALQICMFFNNGVFDKSNTTVLIKKYKHKSRKIIGNILTKNRINHQFVTEKDLDALAEGVMFYPFNAQSNCRAVANRKLTHIFITHGESNKISSIKPIIRIYDYVITAGRAGIERYLVSGIFSQHDVDTGRIIMLGDTFIGRTGLADKGVGQGVVFYAPTWEGGIEQENYSSLSYVDKVAKTLTDTAKTHQLDTIVIKPHPNTGHRLKIYHDYLFGLAKLLRHHQLKVVIFKPYTKMNTFRFLRYKKSGVKFSNHLEKYHAIVGFCDISAMETQFLNEGIGYYLFLSRLENLSLFTNKNYPISHTINLFDDNCSNISVLNNGYYQILTKFFIEQRFLTIPINQRIEVLLNSIISNLRKVS